MNKRFELKKNEDMPGWWVFTDTENLIVIKFKEHEYNETQRITVIDEERFNTPDAVRDLSVIMQEMDDYMSRCWYSIAMPTPVTELRENPETGKYTIIRHKYPRFVIEVEDDADLSKIAGAVKNAGAFISGITRRQWERGERL